MKAAAVNRGKLKLAVRCLSLLAIATKSHPTLAAKATAKEEGAKFAERDKVVCQAQVLVLTPVQSGSMRSVQMDSVAASASGVRALTETVATSMRLTHRAGVSEEVQMEEESINVTLPLVETHNCNVAHQFTASTAMKSSSTGPTERFFAAFAQMERSSGLMAKFWSGGLRRECEAAADLAESAKEERPSTASTATRSLSTDPMAKF